MMKPAVLCVGLVCIDQIHTFDQYPEEDSDERCLEQKWCRGGNASNMCTVLKQLDATCEYFGTIAQSEMSQVILDDFSRHGIDFSNCIRVSGSNCPTAVVILSRKTGSRTVLGSIKNLPELKHEDFTRAIDVTKGHYDWIHFEGRYNFDEIKKMMLTIDTFNKSTVGNCQSSRITVSVELEKRLNGLKSLLGYADYVFVGKDFAQFCGYQTKEEAVGELSKQVRIGATVICTWGEGGASAAVNSDHAKVISAPAAKPDQVVDTLGAGDTFNAAAIFALRNGRDLEMALNFACKIAGTKVSMHGFEGLGSHINANVLHNFKAHNKMDAKVGLPDQEKMQVLKDIANKIRIHSIESTSAAGSGHPTSSCSAAEILSVLFFHTMRFRVQQPKDVVNDRLVLSKGHACPALYGAWAEAGLFPASELKNLRKIDSDLEGHPTPRLNFIDVATGSLGQGLSVAAGMAYTGKYFDKSSYRVYCVCGDGETAEGSVWEALHFSSLYMLDNLTLIIDCNRLGQSCPTSLGHQLDVYQQRLEAFGWHVFVVEGDDVEALAKALIQAQSVVNQPTAVIAKTYKGAGIIDIENKDGFHGKPLGAKTNEALEAIRSKIANKGPHGLTPQVPSALVPPVDTAVVALPVQPNYKRGEMVAPRVGYGSALAKLGKAYDRIIALDGDMGNSTFSRKLQEIRPNQFIECYICEQNMVGVALGVSCRDRAITFASTFGSFLSRAYDQIRMAAVSFSKINLVGTHCGVSIGPDGPSQMALEDLAMFRAIPDCAVFYPSDAVSMENAVVLAANYQGMTFIRASRADAPVLYENNEQFQIGQAKVVRKSNRSDITIVAAGVTLVNAMNAADELAASGVNCLIIDPFTVKPLDNTLIVNNAHLTDGKILVVEDHYYEGGLGEAVMAACAPHGDITVKHLAIGSVPRSGPGPQLMTMFGIDSSAIVKAVKDAVGCRE